MYGHKPTKRRDLASIKLPELHNNPLDLFPTKNDVIRKTFVHTKSLHSNFGQSETESAVLSRSAEQHQWLSPTKIDPNVRQHLLIKSFPPF